LLQYHNILLPARPASDKEIKEFEAEENKREKDRLREHQKEILLLEKSNLRHSDFCRFRDVWEDASMLFVRTRENGVDGLSTDAIRNKNFLERLTDDFDQTYVTYRFTVPAQQSEDNQ